MGLRQLNAYAAKYSQGLDRPLQFAGTPVNNSTFLGRAALGALVVDTTTGKLYSVIASTPSVITFQLIGLQT